MLLVDLPGLHARRNSTMQQVNTRQRLQPFWNETENSTKKVLAKCCAQLT